ncbi:hypothetical protein ACP0JK_26450 [Pseudomonas aeruginosa]
MSKELNKTPVEQAGGDERVVGWRERILAAHPNSDPGFWPDALLVEHMAAEIADLRAALAIASSAQTEHERDTLGQALGECIEAAGITTPGTPLTGPQLLMFAKDLKRDLKRAALAQPSPASNLDPHAEAFNEAPAEALKSEQAEAERPEVASLTADLYEIAERILEIAEGRPKAISTTLMAPVRDYRLKDAKAVARVMGERLVALADRYVHHDRVAGALRFERQQMDRSFTACINERDAANARLHEVATACATAEQERDAALARVAELEKQEPVAYVLFRDGEVYYETDDNIVISNTPGDETDLYMWLPVFTAPVAQAQHSVPEGVDARRVRNLDAGTGGRDAEDGGSIPQFRVRRRPRAGDGCC